MVTTISTHILLEELKSLRKGRGVRAPQMEHRVGPALREVCGVTDAHSPSEIRDKVIATLSSAIATLPSDMRTAVLAALGLYEAASQPFLAERIEWAAEALSRDSRTVRRRLDEGLTLLAERMVLDGPASATATSAVGERGWHTSRVQAVVRLDVPVPELIETREIIADTNNLSTLELAVSAGPPTQHGPPTPTEVELFYGGTLEYRGRQGSRRHGLALRLPAPLERGQRHSYALRYRTPTAGPYYAFTPRDPCEQLELIVRFRRRPTSVVVLRKVFQEDLHDPAVHGQPTTANAAGELHLRFDNLMPGFSYGARWTPYGLDDDTATPTGYQLH